jgi:predicted kinase
MHHGPDRDQHIEVRSAIESTVNPEGSGAVLIALIGVPGAKKSQTAHRLARHDENVVVLSLDHTSARLSTWGESHDPSTVPEPVRILHGEVADHLTAGRTVVVDAIHAIPGQRKALLRIATHCRAATLAVICAPDLEKLLRRNKKLASGHRIPRSQLTEWHQMILDALPLLPAEGWHGIAVF